MGHSQEDYWHVKYHGAMHNATFCGAFPGDGWSGSISSAVFAGCVPVIVMDGIEMPFENVLHYPSFSVRIKEADVPRLPSLTEHAKAKGGAAAGGALARKVKVRIRVARGYD